MRPNEPCDTFRLYLFDAIADSQNWHRIAMCVASHADILLARHLGRKDCVTSQKNVCVGGYHVCPLYVNELREFIN